MCGPKLAASAPPGWAGGAGYIGSVTAKHLLDLGHTVRVWNRTASRCAPLVALGATLVSDDGTFLQKRGDVLFASPPDSIAGRIEARNWSGMDGVYRVLCDSRNGFEVLEAANALARLPEKYRLPLLLFYFDGLSTRRVAEALGIRFGTLRTTLHFARRKVAAVLREMEGAT